jgi:hypothetical protein
VPIERGYFRTCGAADVPAPHFGQGLKGSKMGNFVSKEPFDLKKFLEAKAEKRTPRYQPFKGRQKPTEPVADPEVEAKE